MRLKTVFVRCYKSFNYDYLRKVHKDARFDSWDLLDQSPYPYLRIPLDPAVTTIVGANESGKSHLLSAIEKGLTGERIEPEDFCRYSQFFSVEQGKIRSPEFGFECTDLSAEDRSAVLASCGVADSGFERFLFFRTQDNHLSVYLPSRDKYSQHPVIKGKEDVLTGVLPRVFRIRPDVALPDSVSLLSLIDQPADRSIIAASYIPRSKRFELMENISAFAGKAAMFESDEAVQKNAPTIRASVSSILQSARSFGRTGESEAGAGTELAKDLLFKVAKIDKEAIRDLYAALREGNDGHANGLIQKINQHLAATLNFPHWWVQDRDFQLVVTPRDHDLVLTIRDRTGTDYSFAERSGGLKYFLSYYVQYRAHTPIDSRPEILLMDEPDAHLSSEGQQDLLKVFDAFASPTGGQRPVQVVYVTHSPFLIDRNHSERIRVLEKGVSEEGTRVVKDAARNHYEPLRSAFGAFVGETTFIGNCNLVVEGSSDQVLLAGAATQLRSTGAAETETLDLNHLTIVPAGSASHVPYLVFLARGRDIEQPAVIVLLDSDTEGDQAVKALKRGGPRKRQLLRDSLVIQVARVEGVIPAVDNTVSTEDLIPMGVALGAVRAYSKEFCGFDIDDANELRLDALAQHPDKSNGLFALLQDAFANAREDEPHLDKVGFARCVIEHVSELRRRAAAGDVEADDLVKKFDKNFRAVFVKLNSMKRDAERESRGERVANRVERAKRSFVLDNPLTATRERGALLLEEIEAVLDQTMESDEIRSQIQGLRRDYQLDINLTEHLPDLRKFIESLERLRYAGRLATQQNPNDTRVASATSPSTVELQTRPIEIDRSVDVSPTANGSPAATK